MVQHLSAAVPELYEEICLRNEKIEARLHADHMTTSDHPTLVKWNEQLAMLDFSNEVVLPSEFEFIPIYAVDQLGTLIFKSHDPEHLRHSRVTASR